VVFQEKLSIKYAVRVTPKRAWCRIEGPHLSWNVRESLCVYQSRRGRCGLIFAERLAGTKFFEVLKMKETRDLFRIVGIILLGLFILVVGVPLVLAAAGITLGLVGMVFGLAVGLIKLAIVVAIVYLVLVGIRAMLR
jgi:hypothetical protein